MAQSVAEILPVSRLFNHISGKAVSFRSGHTRAEALQRRLLSFQHNLIDFFLPRVCLSDHYRPRHIRAVALITAAEVHRDKIAVFQGLFRGHGMGHRRMVSRGHNRVKACAFRPVAPHEIFQLRRNLKFRNSGLQLI